MLIISNEQFLEELKFEKSKSMILSESNSTQIDNKVLIPELIEMENKTYDGFRKPAGIPNIPNEIKPIIGALACIENHDAIAEAFKISKDTIGNLANDNHRNPEVTERKEGILESIKQHTLGKIDKCVEFLEVTKDLPRKDLLATAESLSRIHRNIITPNPTEGDGKVQFIFYAPERQKPIEEYGEVIESSR